MNQWIGSVKDMSMHSDTGCIPNGIPVLAALPEAPGLGRFSVGLSIGTLVLEGDSAGGCWT